MPVAFNPFNPAHYFGAFFGSAPIAREPRPAAGTPIEIKAGASDAGVQVTTGRDSITLRGTTAGPEPARDIFGGVVGDYARSVSFSLDADKAPTKDIFGNQDYREKNSRRFTLLTGRGMSAEDCAKALAAKVNKEDDFRAKVSVASDGAATIQLERR